MKKVSALISLLMSGFIGTLHAEMAIEADRYVLSEGFAMDKKTGLTWARCSAGQKWLSGKCLGKPKKFTFAGAQKLSRGDWRVPTKKELETLIFPSGTNVKIDTRVFPTFGKQEEFYWTSEQFGDTNAWYADFKTGIVDYHFGDYDFLREGFFVRLVKTTDK